jgi:hypothetical protein
MTTYNGAAWIGPSIESVLAQKFDDFELVVVDDCSVDATADRIAAYRDGRLRVLRPSRNLGIVGARNFGFAACRGAYIAALDHDDLSHPDRLAIQADYLDRHPSVVLVGTGVRITEAGRTRGTDHRVGGTPLLLRWMLHVDNPLTYSSVMFRAAAIHRLGTFMRPEYEFSDDFDLYHRLLGIGDIVRLDDVLTTYRWHARNTSHSQGDRLFENAVRVLAGVYQPWFDEAAPAAARLVVRHLSDRQPPRDAATLRQLGVVMERVLVGFCSAHAEGADRAEVTAHAGRVWWRAVRSAVRSGQPGVIRQYRNRPALCQGFVPSLRDLLSSCSVGALRALIRLPAELVSRSPGMQSRKEGA